MHPTPDKIMQIGLGFWASKTLLSAVELGLFTELAKEPASSDVLMDRLGLHARGTRDFLDTLVALGFLEREGDTYSNAVETSIFLDRAKPSYIGGILEMANARLYPSWGNLTEALRTGKPQNEAKDGEDFFETLYADPHGLRQFLEAMTGISIGSARAIAEKFPWSGYKSYVDIGCAQGGLIGQVSSAHPHLTGIGFDLPPVGPIFSDYVEGLGIADRVRFHAGDFTSDPLPSADVITMGHILHDWHLEHKCMLIAKAYEALPPGGALIVHESIIDDERCINAFGLMMSLNMLVETPGGYDFTGADCCGWLREAGFTQTYVEHLVGPDSMVVGIK